MPKLPTYQAQTSPNRTLSVRNISTAGIGASVENLGNAVYKRELETDRANAQQKLSELRTRFTADFQSQISHPDTDPTNFSERFDTQIGKETDALHETFHTREGQAMFQEGVNGLRQTFLQRSIQYQAEAARQNAINKFGDSLNNSRNVLLSDPSQFKDVLQEQGKFIDGMSIDAVNKTHLREMTARGLSLSAVEGQILVDPAGTEKELTAGKWDKYLDADAKAQMLARARSQGAAHKSEVTAAINDVKPRYMEGLDIPPEELAHVNTLVNTLNDPEVAKQWHILQSVHAQNSKLRALRPSDVQTYIDAALSPRINDTATQTEYALFDAANNMLGNMRKEIARDPMSWASRAGVVALTPLSDPGSYHARAKTAVQVAHYYGVKPLPFTQDEANEIKQRLDAATPFEQMVELKRLNEGLGGLSQQGLAQLGNESGLYAYAGTLLNIDPKNSGVVQSMLQGAKMLRDDKKTGALLGSGVIGADATYSQSVSNAFQFIPKMQAAVRASTNALYVKLATDQGVPDFSPKLYRQALSMTLGGNGDPSESGVAKRNGVSFVLPPGTTDGQFDQALQRVTPDMLTKLSEGGSPPRFADGKIATPAEIEDEGRFHSIGHGRYVITMQDGGYLLGSGPNGYYTLTLKSDQVDAINKMSLEELKKLGLIGK